MQPLPPLPFRPLLNLLTLSMVLLGTACSPTLNWRDVEVGSMTRLQFPCRPELAERSVVLAGAPSRALMKACDAGGLSWSATVFEVSDPARLTASLRELRLSLATRLQGSEASALPVVIAGMTPNEEARRVVIVGLPEGSGAGRVEAVFVSRGLQVFQFVVMARQDAPRQWADSADEFLRSVRWPG